MEETAEVLQLSPRTVMREWSLAQAWSRLTSPQWSADGQGWYVGSFSPSCLLYVDQKGQARVLSRVADGGYASPDGRYLAFPAYTWSSNVWMIENFDQR